jgi:hypothetical protein
MVFYCDFKIKSHHDNKNEIDYIWAVETTKNVTIYDYICLNNSKKIFFHIHLTFINLILV